MRDVLDVHDAEAIVSLGSVIAQGAEQMRTFAIRVHGEQHGDRVRCTIVRTLNSRYGLRSVRGRILTQVLGANVVGVSVGAVSIRSIRHFVRVGT